MPYEFRGENLVYVEPPEVTGYTWTSSGGGMDTAPTERWVRNADFDPSSILNTKTDKYGREVSSLKPDASEADKRAYNLSLDYDPSDWEVKSRLETGITPDYQNFRNSNWWDVDPAIQERWEAANRANSGNAVGMSGFGDWVVPLSILAAGAGTAIGTGALAGGAAAGEAGGAIGAAEAGGFGLNPASTTGIGFNAGSPSGIMATQSAAGLGGSGTGIIEGLLPSSVGMGGTAGAGSLSGIAGTQAAAGLGSLGAGLTAEQLAAYEAANPGMSASEILKTANTAKNALSTANSVSKLLSGSGATKTGTTGGVDLSKLASLLRPTNVGPTSFGQIKMNQNPFSWATPGQTVASEDMYDVSGTNPMANALRKR